MHITTCGYTLKTLINVIILNMAEVLIKLYILTFQRYFSFSRTYFLTRTVIEQSVEHCNT